MDIVSAYVPREKNKNEAWMVFIEMLTLFFNWGIYSIAIKSHQGNGHLNNILLIRAGNSVQIFSIFSKEKKNDSKKSIATDSDKSYDDDDNDDDDDDGVRHDFWPSILCNFCLRHTNTQTKHMHVS